MASINKHKDSKRDEREIQILVANGEEKRAEVLREMGHHITSTTYGIVMSIPKQGGILFPVR